MSRRREIQIKRIDGLGRITLGKHMANEQVRVEQSEDGTVTLTPVAVIPKRELWLWTNDQALKSVREGLEQSARGETKSLGSFAQHANDETDD